MEAAAAVYSRAKSAMIAYGMGLTQQVDGVENVQLVVNLLLLRGNIGKPGAGVLPSAAIPTCRVSARSASRKSPSSCRSTSSRRFTASSRRKKRGSTASKRARHCSTASCKPCFSSAAISFVRCPITADCCRRGGVCG